MIQCEERAVDWEGDAVARMEISDIRCLVTTGLPPKLMCHHGVLMPCPRFDTERSLHFSSGQTSFALFIVELILTLVNRAGQRGGAF